MAGSNQFDEKEVRKAYSLMHGGNSLVEVRIIGKSDGKGSRTYSGYFSDADSLIDAMKKRDLSESQVYMTINTINDACYSREQRDCFKTGKVTATSDNDIIGYNFLMVDVDPCRPADTASSDPELQKAKNMGNRIYQFMQDQGFEKPLMAYSGNGIHLMYRVKLGNTKENKELVQKCLKTLDLLFSDEECKVDVANFNPARVSKLYGCVARKGANTKDRPFRMSRIVGEYDTIAVTDKKYLQKLCELYPKEPERQRWGNNYSQKDFDIEEWMARYGLHYRVSSYAEGTKYILDCCPFNSNHKGKDACIFKSRDNVIGFHCFHSSCQDKKWQDVRLLYEPDAYEKKRQWQERQMYQSFNRNRNAPVEKSKPIEKKDGKPVMLTSLDVLNRPKVAESFVRTGFNEIDRRMRGLKKGCVSVVSGLRGSAKSTWLSQLALNAVDYGNNVGFYSGELSPENFMRWMNLQAAGKGRVENGRYEGYYETKFADRERIAKWLNNHFWLYNNEYGNDFLAVMREFEAAVDKCKLDLLVLDNLMTFNIKALSDNIFEAQSKFVLELHKLAQRANVHIIFVAHPRKAMGFLRLDDISGTADLANAVESAFIVHRVNNDFKRLSKVMFGWNNDDDIYKATNVIEIAKDRDGGTQDVFVPLWYEKETKRLRNSETENRIYGWREQAETSGGKQAPAKEDKPMEQPMEQKAKTESVKANGFVKTDVNEETPFD